jgi:phosphoglycolate phosphatase
VGDVRRLIVFDLDGTLIDSRRDLADAANALIVERGGKPLPEEAIGEMVGDGAAMLVRRALAAATITADERSVARFLELYDDRLLHTTRPYAGIHEALEILAAHGVLTVLTNKPVRPTLTLLDALALAPFIATTIGGDGPFPRKPDPTALRHLIATHGSSPRRTVMVGDSRIDFETARAAGTHICIARYGFGYRDAASNELAGAPFVDDPVALPAMLESLLDIW